MNVRVEYNLIDNMLHILLIRTENNFDLYLSLQYWTYYGSLWGKFYFC